LTFVNIVIKRDLIYGLIKHRASIFEGNGSSHMLLY